MTYVFDTSALIGAWVRTYPPDVIPALWEHLDRMAEAGTFLVPEEVHLELKAQDDELAAWVEERSDRIVAPTSRAVMLESKAILADHPGLTKTGKGRGLADPFVIALAVQRRCPVVSHERGGSDQKPRIPFACERRGVRCIEMLELIREQGWRFRA